MSMDLQMSYTTVTVQYNSHHFLLFDFFSHEEEIMTLLEQFHSVLLLPWTILVSQANLMHRYSPLMYCVIS